MNSASHLCVPYVPVAQDPERGSLRFNTSTVFAGQALQLPVTDEPFTVHMPLQTGVVVAEAQRENCSSIPLRWPYVLIGHATLVARCMRPGVQQVPVVTQLALQVLFKVFQSLQLSALQLR
ncbi:hypothetical protein [Stenotrophomonas sp. PSU_St103]